MSTPWRASAAARSLSGLRVRPRRWNPAALQRLRDRAALIACHSGDENRSIVRHGLFLLHSKYDFSVNVSGLTKLVGAPRLGQRQDSI